MLPQIDTSDQRLEEWSQGATRSTFGHDEGTDRLPCIFAFAGCTSAFPTKQDWKNHVYSDHIGLQYRVCTRDACGLILHDSDAHGGSQAAAQSPSGYKDQELSNNPKDASPKQPRGPVFRCNEYTEHLLNYSEEPLMSLHVEYEVQKALAHKNLPQRTYKGPQLPVYLPCPVPGCSADFRGTEALELWVDHLGQHLEQIATGDDPSFSIQGLEYDETFTQWAMSPGVAIIQESEAESEKRWALCRQLDSKPPLFVKDSAYGSSGPTNSLAGRRYPDSVRPSNASVLSSSEDHLRQSVCDPGAGTSNPTRLVPIGSTASNTNVASPVPRIVGDITSEIELTQTFVGRLFIDEVAQFTTNWFRAWLNSRFGIESNQALEDHESGDCSGASKSNSGAGSSNRKRCAAEGGGDGHRKRQRGEEGGERDEGGEKSAGDGGDQNDMRNPIDKDPQAAGSRFVCPFFKRDRVKYGQPRWKSCAYPGWTSIPRLKEHLFRRHKLPRYQCGRCFGDMKNADGLLRHQRQLSPCPVFSSPSQDGITLVQEVELKSRSRTVGSCREAEWKRIYKILFPQDTNIPEPHYDNLIGDHSDIMEGVWNAVSDGLPSLVQRVLTSTFYGNLSEMESALTEAILSLLQSTYVDILTGNQVWGTRGDILPQFAQSSRAAEASSDFGPLPQIGGVANSFGKAEMPHVTVSNVLDNIPDIGDISIDFVSAFVGSLSEGNYLSMLDQEYSNECGKKK